MKEKIMDFAAEHWYELSIIAVVAAGEVAICKIYKNWLKKTF